MLNSAISLLAPLRAECRHGDAVVSYVKLCSAAVNWAVLCNYSTWQQSYQDELQTVQAYAKDCSIKTCRTHFNYSVS